MDRNMARGRAAKTVSTMLKLCIKEGMVDELLKKHYTEQEARLIAQEIQNIADTLSRQAEAQRNAEQQNA
jgi:uncharacterized protein (UPF0276 family)